MSLRVQLVQFLHTVNTFTFVLLGCGFLFFTEKMVPAIQKEGIGAAKGMGSFSIVYGLLLATLGWAHHGAYCLTMTLHFALMTVHTLQAMDLKKADGSFETHLLAYAGFSYVMFFSMITILITGGIGIDQPQEEVRTRSKRKD